MEKKTTAEKIAFISRCIGSVHIQHFNTICPPLVDEEIPAHYVVYCDGAWGDYKYQVEDVDFDQAVEKLCIEIWGEDYEI